MSGLEGIAALGLACNILQLIGAVGNTITVAKNILESGTIDPDLEKRTDELTTLFRDAEGSLSRTSQHKDDQELRVAAGQVLKATAEFESELAKISGDASKGKIRQVIRGTVKGFWRRQKLDKLEAEISRCRGIFESRLLLSLRHRLDLGAMQREDGFTRLDSSLQSFVKGLSDGHTKLEELLKYQSTTLMAHVTEESRQMRQEISTTMDTVVLKLSQEEKQRFLGSLRYDTMNERRNSVEIAHSGTYEWIFCDSKNFNDGPVPQDGIPEFIKSATEKIYWISGKPGSGKSTLIKFLIEDSRMKDILNQTSPTGTSTIASHFIWAAGAPIQRSLRGTLASLLFQLVAQDDEAFEYLLSKYPNKPQRLFLSDWSDQQLAGALQTVCSYSQSIVCLMIDGLDEIDSADADKILALIDDLCALTYVKCIASSRPQHVFARHFRELEAPSLQMQYLTARDIRRYVKEKLRSWHHDPDRYRDVVETLCNKAEGVFLWVALALKSQRLSADYEDDPEIVARRFKQLPSGLSELYSSMWDRLNEDKAIYSEEGAKYLNTYLTAEATLEPVPLSKIAFGTHPALVQELFKPSTPSILEHVENTLEKFAVWVEVRTAGLIKVSPFRVRLIHRSALEFLQNDAKGLEITKLDPRTEEERKLSHLTASLAMVKHECDIDRLGQFVSFRHSRILHVRYDLCRLPSELLEGLEKTTTSYKYGEITKAGLLKIFDQAASTYHAIRLSGNKHPCRQCENFLSSMSSDYLGFMARSGFVEYVLMKVEEYLIEKKPSTQYLEYLWAETCYGIIYPVFEDRVIFAEVSPVKLGQWLLSLLPQQNSPSPAYLLGGYQRTATGLVCTRLFKSTIAFHELEAAASQMKKCQNILRDALPEHNVLLRIPWNDFGPMSSHIFEHGQDFNVFIELPLTVILEINNRKERLRILVQSDVVDFSDSFESFMSEMTEFKPGPIFIQSLVSIPRPFKFFNVYPETYFSLKTEADERFVTTAVIRQLVLAATYEARRMRGSALSDFVKSRIADNGFDTISTSQFEEILVKRGHAFRPSQENPWPPAMFEGIAEPGVEEDSGTEDYSIAPAAMDSYPAQVYRCVVDHKSFKVVIEGDVLRVVD